LESGRGVNPVAIGGLTSADRVATVHQIRKKKALEGQGFGGRGENTY
jgi:hypothetical protein